MPQGCVRGAARARTVLLACACALTILGTAAAQDARRAFDIPAQAAADSLQAFARQTGKQVLFPYDAVSGKRAPAISGVLTDSEVLRRLADAAGLVVSTNDGKTITLQPRPPASPSAAPAPAPTLAPAEAAPVGLEEVVVTAQKRSEQMQDVPIAITAVGGAQLRSEGVDSTQDLSSVIPGLTYNKAIGTYGLPVIRGVGTTTQGSGIENPVATYVDGVYIFGTAGAVLSLRDVDQVAVLKGPQGTLFGRNATGGLIQVTTKSPSHAPEFDADATLGNLADSDVGLYATGGLGQQLAANLTADYDQQVSGFGRNLYNGQAVGTHRSAGARAKLLWQPDSQTDVTLSADYSKMVSAAPVNRVYGLTVLGAPMPGGPFDTDLDIQPRAEVEVAGVAVNAKRDFGAVQLVGITAYRSDSILTRFDADGTTQVRQELEGRPHDTQFSQEVQLLSNTSGPLVWMVGAFYMDANAGGEASSVSGSGAPGSARTVVTYGNMGLTSYAGFGQATYKINDSTNLTGGLRFTHDNRTDSASQFLLLDGGGQVATVAPVDASKSFAQPSWRLSLDHRFSAEVMGYVSYNRGFRSGSFVPTTFPAKVLDPEVLDAYEVGIKADLLERRLRINAAGYYYVDRDRKVLQIIAGSQQIFDAQRADSYGMDADLTWLITDRLTLNAGVAAIHARYTDYDNAVLTTPLPTGGNMLSVGSATGNALESTPNWTFNIGPAYRTPTRIGDVRVALNYYRNAGWFAAPDNRVRQPAYDTLAADILWLPAARPNLTVRLWGKNLTNTVYAEQFTETSLSDNFQVAQGRTYGLTLGLHF